MTLFLITTQAKAVDYTFQFVTPNNSINDSKVTQLSISKFSQLQSFIDSLKPPGTINPFIGSVAPSGWLLLNGQSVSKPNIQLCFR